MVEKSVLIIDDEKDVREMLSDIYQTEGFVIKTAGDMKTAQKIINQRQFAVISTNDSMSHSGHREFDTSIYMDMGNFAEAISSEIRDVYRKNEWKLPIIVGYTTKNIDPNFFDAVFVKPSISEYQDFLKELK